MNTVLDQQSKIFVSASAVTMSENERRRISEYIELTFGIKMSEAKKPLLTGRLSKRLHLLGIKTFADYFDFVTSPDGREEYTFFVDLISTHETSFFREPAHFDYMMHSALPLLLQRGIGIERELRVLSAACSTGQEVYSAACVIEEFVSNNKLSNYGYTITGTDISAHVLSAALRAVYPKSVLSKVPAYARKYFMCSRDHSRQQIRVAPEIRQHAQFMQLNLLSNKYPFDEPFDVVFCRNVMIYFDRETRSAVAQKICRSIAPGGYFMVGHSESLIGLLLPLAGVASATYVRR